MSYGPTFEYDGPLGGTHSIDMILVDPGFTLRDYLNEKYRTKRLDQYWKSGKAYVVNDVVRHYGTMYICTQAHTSGRIIDLEKFSLFTDQKWFNTRRDWFLLPSPVPVFKPPKIVERFIEIPGMDGGGIDISDVDTGYPALNRVEGTWDFLIENDHEDWATLYDRIVQSVHGRRVYFVLEDDPWWYRSGRVTVEDWEPGSLCSKIKFGYKASARRTPVYPPDASGSEVVANWLWDPFDLTAARSPKETAPVEEST